jgi:hypothetical protein
MGDDALLCIPRTFGWMMYFVNDTYLDPKWGTYLIDVDGKNFTATEDWLHTNRGKSVNIFGNLYFLLGDGSSEYPWNLVRFKNPWNLVRFKNMNLFCAKEFVWNNSTVMWEEQEKSPLDIWGEQFKEYEGLV